MIEVSRKQSLLAKFENREATIGIVGLGYVGLPLTVAFADAGFNIIGIDLNRDKVEAINSGTSYVEDVPSDQLAKNVKEGKLIASSSYADIAQADAILICVPTPLRKTGDPDITYIISAIDKIAGLGGSNKLVVLESTTYPGTTEEIILPRLIRNGEQVGVDVFIAFSPERIDPGRSDFTIVNTPKVIGGITPACLAVCSALYATIVETIVPVSNPSTAEMVKLLENTFRAVNIGLVNEVALMCDKLGLNTWEVIKAAATKPYGFMPFYPGPGLGGHCIPIDPHYLSWKLRTLNYTARFIELAAEVNGQMPAHVVGKIADALNEECKSVKGSRILILGVAYKPNVSDVRESPALDVIYLLREKGAIIGFHDPYVRDLTEEGIVEPYLDLSESMLQDSDCVVIVTDHDAYDWSYITRHASLIVDTRHAIKDPGRSRTVYL